MVPRRPRGGDSSYFRRRVGHVNNVHYFFLGSRGPETKKKSTPNLTHELRQAGLAKKKPGEPYLVMTKWGKFNKWIRQGFGKPWKKLSEIQQARIISSFVGGHLTEAYFPRPFPPYLRKVPYTQETRDGMCSFFRYFLGLYGSFRRDARQRMKDSHPEARETAEREFLLYSDLISAAYATIRAIEEGKVRW